MLFISIFSVSQFKYTKRNALQDQKSNMYPFEFYDRHIPNTTTPATDKRAPIHPCRLGFFPLKNHSNINA